MTRTLILLLLLPLTAARAQQPDSTIVTRLVLHDGSEVLGSILAETDSTLLFRTRFGAELTLARAQIKRRVDEDVARIGGAYVRLDPNRTRLLFAPTARPLGQGRGYLADYYLFFPFLAYGVADAVSLAGGMSLFPGVGAQLVYVAPKVTIYHDRRRSLAAGTLLGMGGGGTFGVFYGLATFGPPTTSVTVGGGTGMLNGDFAQRPVLLLGLEHQLSGSVKLLSENYAFFPPEQEPFFLVSGGIRFFGSHLAADFALVTSPNLLDEVEGFAFVPFVGFAYNFGN